MERTRRRPAPGAIRIPISRVRRATEKANHAVQADRCENGGKCAEAGAEHRDQAVGEERFVDARLHRFQIEDGEIGVDFRDFTAKGGDDRFGGGGSAHLNRDVSRGGVLEGRHVAVAKFVIAQAIVFRVLDDADNFDVKDVFRDTATEFPSQGIFAVEEILREGFVDDGNLRYAGASASVSRGPEAGVCRR